MNWLNYQYINILNTLLIFYKNRVVDQKIVLRVNFEIFLRKVPSEELHKIEAFNIS